MTASSYSAPGTRFLTAIGDEPAVEDTQPATTTSDVFGQDMELINPETERQPAPPPPPAQRRYPRRDRRPPDRL